MKICYEVLSDGTMLRAWAPIRGIHVPLESSLTTKDLTPGWYVATLDRGCLSLDCATFSRRMTREQAMKQVGGDPYEGYEEREA